MNNIPLVSCICVTKNPWEILKRSIFCFLSQTYANKELVIVRQGNDKQIASRISALRKENIKLYIIPNSSNVTIGEMRNFAIDRSAGHYFCAWDDDDWHHPDRIAKQMEPIFLGNFEASVLTNLLIYDETTKKGYFSGFRLWEGTILCNKIIYNQGVRYPHLSRNEDANLLAQIHKSGRVFPVVGTTEYIYIYHGNNTWNQEHFLKNIFRQELSPEVSNILGRITAEDPSNELPKTKELSRILKELNHFYTK